ncbi:tryptophan 7-halogenase [Qipengyuania atrilutea]|uniref:Tryptophan 7-halogenase n=1 Tax=Qipengyuania atrilutea TaxID=2744473 RepID=A0A850H2K0_9SPHN|nr:tryptophan 7-halogenase [Actirhodobacter atriluteus]NVD44807.1 tryptophan 7-halogenase [Actirhodobacter atriluteus]
MSEPREPLRNIIVAGGGQLGVLTALALKRAVPMAQVTVVGTPPDPNALADRLGTALPFTNRLHDRLGVDEAVLVSEAGASHRLLMRTTGFTAGHEGFAAYGALPETKLRSRFAREWGGGSRSGSAQQTVGSLAEALVASGRFRPPGPGESTPLAEVDYALRWNVGAYRSLLIGRAQKMGVQYVEGEVASLEADADGTVSAIGLTGGQVLGAELFVDCSGTRGALVSRLPRLEWNDWSAYLPVRAVVLERPGRGVLALEDHAAMTEEGWVVGHAARDGHQRILGVRDSADPAQAADVLGGSAPVAVVPLSPGAMATPWQGNVVALGDAAARFEPLGFLNLDLAHRQLDLLLELLPGREVDARERGEFNRRAELMAEGVRDTLGLYYAALEAERVYGRLERSPALENLLDQYARRGRIPHSEEGALMNEEIVSLLAALGIEGGEIPVSRAEGAQGMHAAQGAFAAKVDAALAASPPYAEWLQSVLAPAPG